MVLLLLLLPDVLQLDRMCLLSGSLHCVFPETDGPLLQPNHSLSVQDCVLRVYWHSCWQSTAVCLCHSAEVMRTGNGSDATR